MVVLPIARAARIVGENLEALPADVARTLSMWSIAGMMVARFGVPCEKYNVASLKICIEPLYLELYEIQRLKTRTFSTSRSSSAIFHSSGINLYLRRSKSRVA